MIFNMTGGGGSASKGFPEFEFTGQYAPVIDDGVVDGKQNWRLKLLTSGTLTFTKNPGDLDVFLVGGGGGGGYNSGGGGGGGYTKTGVMLVDAKTPYAVIIGGGGSGADASTPATDGGDSSINGAIANGGKAGISHGAGGDGASGGGGGGPSPRSGGLGGSDGSDGVYNVNTSHAGGTGQGTTTREFAASVINAYVVGETALDAGWLSLTEGGEALIPAEGVIYSVMTEGEYWYRDFIWNGTSYIETDIAKVYSGGGGGGGNAGGMARGGAGGGGNSAKSGVVAEAGETNTGGGGGGGTTEGNYIVGAAGGSGIVVIRNHRGVTA